MALRCFRANGLKEVGHTAPPFEGPCRMAGRNGDKVPAKTRELRGRRGPGCRRRVAGLGRALSRPCGQPRGREMPRCRGVPYPL